MNKIRRALIPLLVSLITVIFLPSAMVQATNNTTATAGLETSYDVSTEKIITLNPNSTFQEIMDLVSKEREHRVIYFNSSDTRTHNINSDSADVTHVSMYQEWDFSGRSAPETIVLQADCDTISLHATCEGDVIDTTVTFEISDITYDGSYSSCLKVPADGSVTTVVWSLPAGKYKVCFTGDHNITKNYALVVFSRFNTGILSNSAEKVHLTEPLWSDDIFSPAA